MPKVWVLDTETKGTGAEMVPLEKVERHPAARSRRSHRRTPRSPPTKPRAPRAPRKFKVVDVMSGRVLAEGVDLRAAVEVLAGMRSIVDAAVHVWEETPGRWRSLKLDERRGLWALRRRRPVSRQPVA